MLIGSIPKLNRGRITYKLILYSTTIFLSGFMPVYASKSEKAYCNANCVTEYNVCFLQQYI